MKTIHDYKLALNWMTTPPPCKVLIVIGTGPVARKPVTEAGDHAGQLEPISLTCLRATT
jgi:hypothetical protein